MLRTAQDVINRVGVASLREYFDVRPMTDCAGFAVQRSYPPQWLLARAVTKEGRASVTCLIQFIVDPPSTPSGVSPVRIHARLYNRYSGKQLFVPPSLREVDFSDPESPTPESVHILEKSARPIDIDFMDDDFAYDNAEDSFYDATGEVTGKDLLDFAYEYHCRTLRRRFRVKWCFKQSERLFVFKVVWRGQDLCMWLLRHGYDIVLTPEGLRWPFHKYHPSEFKRTTDEANSSFFGFQTSKRSLFSNLVVLVSACVLAYYTLPRFRLLRAIYANTALTTAALLFGFLLADQLGPLALQRAVCFLSRMRGAVAFVTQKVKA